MPSNPIKPNQIVLAIQPHLLRELLRLAILRDLNEFDISETPDSGELPSRGGSTDAGWLVTNLNANGQLSPPVQQFLGKNPNIGIIALAQDWKEVVVIAPQQEDERWRAHYSWLTLDELYTILTEGPEELEIEAERLLFTATQPN
jgi:hypothetical protein